MEQGFGYENTTRRVEIFLFKPIRLDLACGGEGLPCDKTNFIINDLATKFLASY